jgi:hypothetical protein
MPATRITAYYCWKAAEYWWRELEKNQELTNRILAEEMWHKACEVLLQDIYGAEKC